MNWFGGLDLNQPAEEFYDHGFNNNGTGEGTSGGNQRASHDEGPSTTRNSHGNERAASSERASRGMSAAAQHGGSGGQTGVTLSSEDSGSDDEVQSTPEGVPPAPRTPFIGMKFDSDELAQAHYNRYAKFVGFSIKRESSRRSARDGEVNKRVFVCNKSGKSTEKEPVPLKDVIRPITILTDCKAKMRIKRTGVKWEVTQFLEGHNHEVTDKFALKKYLRSHKKIPPEEKKFINLLYDVNLSSGRIMEIMGSLYGGVKNVPYDAKTVSNYTATIDDKYHIKDIPELLDYFEEIKKHEDPNFFYKTKLDSMDRVENIFWVDGAAREVYKLYHDCISFDTTYMVNMYNMPCAPFIGINRYGQSIQLGCGFVRHEQIENFVWLFETFLQAMGGLHPLNIITDQAQAIRTAILIVFLDIIHRFCRWHIMQKVQEKLGPFIATQEQLRLEFNDVIDHSLTREEFEARWAEMLLKHNVVDHPHFIDIYALREFFVPAYFKDRFFPFLQTTARSEGFNAVLKRYVNPQDSILRFFKQFMKIQAKIEVAEDRHEFVGEDKTLRVWSDYPMEQQVLETYTLPIYRRFQLELRKTTSYNCRDVGGGFYEVFPIQKYVFGYGSRSYMVAVDLEAETFNCACCKFSKDGMLCCHAMKVMAQLGAVKRMPAHYILPRWCVPPPDIVPPPLEPQQIPTGKLSRKDMRMLRYGNLCTDFARRAVNAAVSDKTAEIADKHMNAMDKEIAEYTKSCADAAKRKKKAKLASNVAANADDEGTSAAGTSSGQNVDQDPFNNPMARNTEPMSANNKKAKDPPTTTRRGRPSQKRKKGGLQLQQTRSTICSVCNESNHDARNCPIRIANPEKYPLLSLFQ